MSRGARIGVLVGLAAAAAAAAFFLWPRGPMTPPAGRVVQGSMWRLAAGSGAPAPSPDPAEDLYSGDVVETRDAAAVMRLGGARLAVPQKTRLRLAAGEAAVQAGSGAVRAEGGESGIVLSVDTPTGVTRIRADPRSTVELTVGEGVRVAVSVGDAVIERGGTSQRAGVGEAIELGVGEVAVERPKPGAPASIARVVGKPPARMAAEQGGWQPVSAPGATVALPLAVESRGGHARVEVGAVAVQVSGRADRVRIDRPAEAGKLPVAVEAGAVAIEAADGQGATVDIGGAKVHLVARADATRARIAARRSETTVEVAEGSLDIEAEGAKLDLVAGERATFAPAKGWRRSAAAPAPVQLKPGEDATVLHAGTRPGVGAAWPGNPRATVEVAEDAAFTRSARRAWARSGSARIGCDGRRRFWRIADRPTLSGSVVCSPASRVPAPMNEVFDSGEKTVVYYQKRVPELHLKFDASVPSTVYIYGADDLTRPIRKETVSGGMLKVLPGEVAAGKYVWYRHSEGGARGQQRMNELEIRPETEVSPIEVVSVTERIDGRRRVGVRAPNDGELTVNGVPARLERSIYQTDLDGEAGPLVVRWSSGRRSLYLYHRAWGRK